MRARQRHLNPKAAGALAALDARFVTGLNNGDAVSTWTNRTGSNDFTQTSTARPTFTTTSINGNPAITFDGVNDLMGSPSITFLADFCVVAVARLNRAPNYTPPRIDMIGGKRDYNTTTPRTQFAMYLTNTFGTTTNTFVQTEAYSSSSTLTSSIVNGASVSPTGAVTSGTPAIVSCNFSGVNLGSAAAMQVGQCGLTGGNPESGYYAKIDLGYFTYVSGSSASLRRRFENAAAYSFKIACS